MGLIKYLTLLLISISSLAKAQDTLQQNKRLKPLIITSASAYAVTLVGLDRLWYSDFERESFHFFNDNHEWNQVDKVGHFYSAFHISSGSHRILQWAGVSNEKAELWGALTSVIVMTPIEIFDGFSSAYGASYGDLIANSSGTLFFYGQQKLWGEIRLQPKISFRKSGYAELRPNVLGSNLPEQMLKDYNGQTYWLSVNLSKFIHGNFPKWLNLAVGYGATGMVAASEAQNQELGYHSSRQYYLSLDLDFSEYESKSKFVNSLLYVVSMIKIPSPTLSLNRQELKFHFFY